VDNARTLLKVKLKAHGLSLTKARAAVFRTLLGYGPLEMSELIARTSDRVDRASAYRAIAVFEQANISQRVRIADRDMLELSEVFEGHHHHFVCTNCGRLIPINDRQLESYIDNLPSLSNQRITNHQLEIQGICQNCLAKANP
jgi:Fe2+ or Zn2+ uptake regulation protein